MTVDRARLEALVAAWDPAGPTDLPPEVARALDDDPAFRAWFDGRFTKARLMSSSTPLGLAGRVMPPKPARSPWGRVVAVVAAAAVLLIGVTGLLLNEGGRTQVTAVAPVEPPAALSDEPTHVSTTVAPVDTDEAAVPPSVAVDERALIAEPAPVDDGPIKAALQKNATQLKYCYEVGLRSNPSLAGRVVMDWTFAEGRVSNARVSENTTGDDALADCVLGKVRRWNGFPREAEGDVTWPFVFKQKGTPALVDDNAIVEMVKDTVKTELPKLRYSCYEPLLRDDPVLQGSWLLHFTVQTDGSVAAVTASPNPGTVPSPALEQCLREQLQAWRFLPIRAELPVRKTIGFKPK